MPLAEWANDGMRWLTSNHREIFQAIKRPVKWALDLVEDGLRGAPQSLMVIIFTVFAWQIVNRTTAIVTFFAMFVIGIIGAWDAAMTSLAVLMTAVAISTLVGLPLGILCFAGRLALVHRPTGSGFHADDTVIYLSRPGRPAVWHRQRSGRHRHRLFCNPAARPPDQSRLA